MRQHDFLMFSPGAPIALLLLMLDPSSYNPLTRQIIGGAIEVHRALGPGLLESVYFRCLMLELTLRKLRFVTERAIPIVYKGMPASVHQRVDLIVENLVVVEVKAVHALIPIHEAQTLTYLRLSALPIGLLINFNVARLMDGGVKRLLNPRSRGNGFHTKQQS